VKFTRSSLILLGALGIAIFAGLAVLAHKLDNRPYRVVLRPTACQAATQFGLAPTPMPGGACEVIGTFEPSLASVTISGITIAKSEVVAYWEAK